MRLFDDPVVDMTKGPTLTPRTPLERAVAKGHAEATKVGNLANAVKRDWVEHAAAAVLRFAEHRCDPWLLEDAREHAEERGLAAPPDKRAWGAVIQTLKRRGAIVGAGYAPTTSSNGSPKCLWRLAGPTSQP